MDLTRQQAYDATKLCLKNARDFLDDAKMHYENKRLQHIRIPLVFALEEAGKAKVMMDQLQAGDSVIEMNPTMRRGHQIKVDYIKQFVKVSPQKEQYYEDVWSNFPFLSPTVEPVFTGEAEEMRKMFKQQMGKEASEKFVKLDQDILNGLITGASEKRLGTFVNFDENTHDANLAPPMREGDCDLLIDTLYNMLDNFDNTFNQINS